MAFTFKYLSAFSPLLLTAPISLSATQVEHALAPPALQNDQMSHAVQTCYQHLASIKPGSKEVLRVKKRIEINLHLRGSAHNFIPHYQSTYEEMRDVYKSLAPSDIPYLVKILADDTTSSGVRATTISVLTMFDHASLACIDAALMFPDGKNRQQLESVRTNITVLTPPRQARKN